MTDDTKIPAGFERNADGRLTQKGFRGFEDRGDYQTPDEAVLTWWAGKLRFGCNERCFSNYNSHPCANPAKYDPDHRGNPTKCGHHSAAALARRKAKEAARDAAYRAKNALIRAKRLHNENLLDIVQRIADGHNDPRGLCADWLERKVALDKGEIE